MMKARFYGIVQEEALVSLHPELPPTLVWRYRDVNAPEDCPFLPGPTFQVRMGEPQVIRQMNRLPSDHVGFGVPHTTTHYHGALPGEMRASALARSLQRVLDR